MLRCPNNATMTWIRCHHEVKFICTLALRFAKSGYTWSRTSLFRIIFYFLLYCSIFMPSIWRRGKEIYCPFAYDLDGLWQCSRLVCDQSRKKYAYLHFLFWAQLFFIIRQMDYWLICGWLVYCCSGAFCGALEGVRWQSFCMPDFAWRMEYGDQPDRLNE